MDREDKNKELFFKQKETLDLFLKNGNITFVQYRKSLGCMAEKMGFYDLVKEELENSEVQK